MTDLDSENLSVRYQGILTRIDQSLARRQTPQDVTLIAVSKKQPVDLLEKLFHLGHRDFGENYVQELIEKAEELDRRGCKGIRWHFIGHLQSNKIKTLLPYVFCLHTLESEKAAQKIAQRWSDLRRATPLPVFIEVNLDHEASKSGLAPSKTPEFVKKIATVPQLKVLGLMCIPARGADSRARFMSLRELEGQCRPYSEGKLSMGMSEDFGIAVEEGATHIRVGTPLFGARKFA